MKIAKTLILLTLIGQLFIACAPKRKETQFSINKEAEAGTTYTEAQLRSALGSANYDILVSGIGQSELNLLTYGIGISNMTQLLNAISNGSKLVALMSNSVNGNKLDAIKVLTLMNALDDECQRVRQAGAESTSTDTILKLANMINMVTLQGMDGLKNIVHGILDQPADLNGVTIALNRLGMLLALLNENLSVMPTIVSNVAAPGGVFSATGTARLLRLVNESLDLRDLARVINNTTNITNLTDILTGLTNNMFCSKPRYTTSATCTANGGAWTNTSCSNPLYTTRASCAAAAGTWTTDGIENMLRVLNEINRSCANVALLTGNTCIAGGATWSTNATRLATIVNSVTVVTNLNIIINMLTNDGKKPGDIGNVADGVDAMVATLNNTIDITKLSYVINGLNSLTPDVSNDDNFESAATSCATNTRTELAKFNYGVNKMASGANTGLKSWFVNSAVGATGACAAQSDPTLGNNEIAAMEYTANITTAGTASFKYKVSSESPSAIKFVKVLTGGTLYTTAPTVTFTGGGGTGAAATAVVAAGSVGTLTLLTPGSGYTSNPTVAFTGGGGTGASAVANRIPVAVSSVAVNNGGSYTTAPTATLSGGGEVTAGSLAVTLPTTSVNGVAMTAGGNNYTSAPACAISGGGGAGATCTAQVPASYGTVTALTLTATGTGYTSNPTCAITGGGGAGATCTATRTLRIASIAVANAGPCTITVVNFGCTVGANCGGSGGGCAVTNTTTGCFLSAKVGSFSVTNAGTGYLCAPTISASNGGTGTATMVYESLILTITAAGSGYTSNPTVTISGGGGAGATATATIGSGPISGITLGAVGAGYSTVPTLTLTGGGGTGALGVATIPQRAITAVSVISGGLYTSAPTVVFSGGTPSAAAAVATATVPPSAIESLTLTNGGSGYTSNPTVTISGGGGTGATASASADPMSVIKINLTSGGTGYTSPPTVTLTGGGGSGASAVAYVSGDYFKFYVDDVLQAVAYGAPAWATFTTANLPVGIHRFRWEYVKDDAISAGTNQGFIDDILLPGNRGVTRLAAEKVAILLNKLYLTSINNVADILNATTLAPGLDNLVAIINQAEFPADINAMPSLVAIVNNLSQISTLTDILNNLNTTVGVKNMVEIVDHVGQGNKLASFVKNLAGVSPGVKMTNIINGLDSQGTSALIRAMDKLGAAFPLLPTDDLNEMVTLINGITTTTHIPAIINELSLAGSQSTVVGSNSSPTGGQKLGLVLQAAKAKSIATGEAATCNTNTSSFCTKNHLVRLMNDIATSVSGPSSVGKIVTLLDANALVIPGWTRMIETLYALKTMHTTLYTNALDSSIFDIFGRLTTMIGDMGVSGAPNIARLVNEVNDSYLSSRVAYLVQNTNRVRYVSRLITEMTNVDLVITLLNNASTNIIKINDLLDRQGNLTYGTAAIGTNPASYYGAGGLGALDTSTVDGLGRLIVLINEVSGTGVNNIVSVINSTFDLNFLSSATATFTYGAKTDGNGFGMLNAVNRIRYLSSLMNSVANINLMINIINGQAGNMSDGISYSEMVKLLNNVGASTQKGINTKVVGDVSIIAETINVLGWNTACPCARSLADQMRIVTIVNNARYCGVRPSFDRDATPGNPTTEYYACNNTITYAYNKAVDAYDPRHRVSQFMVGLTNAAPAGIIVGNVTDTNKTVQILNGIRRINLLIKAVNWMPGEVTADLVNYTNLARISTGFVYLANNLDPDEDVSATAFTSMIHWGTGVGGGGTRTGACTYYTAIGPKRLGGVLNTETGQYLEGIIQMFGWRTAIPALVCAFGAIGSGWAQSVTPTAYTANQVSADGTLCTAGAPCEIIAGAVGTSYFKRTETVAIVNNPTVGARFGTNYTHTYRAASQAACESYYPEQSGSLTFWKNTDQIVSQGFNPLWGISVEAGIGGVWDVLKGSGVVGWLLQNGGSLGTPPLVATGNAVTCTDGASGNEWACIQQGKDVAPNISYFRWGNYCSIPGYTTYATCEAAGGRWMPKKNYATCGLNMTIDAPRE